MALQRYNTEITLTQPSNKIKRACILNTFWAHHSKKVLLKTIGSDHHTDAAQTRYPETEQWIQPLTGNNLEEVCAAESSLASHAVLQDYSLFLLFSLTRFSYRYLSDTSDLPTYHKKIYLKKINQWHLLFKYFTRLRRQNRVFSTMLLLIPDRNRLLFL